MTKQNKNAIEKTKKMNNMNHKKNEGWTQLLKRVSSDPTKQKKTPEKTGSEPSFSRRVNSSCFL
jgi:Txe/YoeB family toxin of Txe-Axe toxin-antitoxin module